MALPHLDDASGGAGDAADTFLQQAYLTYIIPFASDFDPEEALSRGEDSVESKIANIEQRDQLFFGTRFAGCSRSGVSHRSFADCR